MKPFNKNSKIDDVEREARAAAWLVEEEAGLTPEQSAAFEQWQLADVRNHQATERLRGAWTALQALRDYRPGAKLHPDPDLLAPRRRRGKPAVVRLAWAAAAAILLTVGVLTYSSGLPALPWTDTVHYVTENEEYYRMILPDGSTMELNSHTEVRVKFLRNERRVRLLSGEAYFIVAKDADRPFIVETNGLQVRAVGTEFNVRMEKQSVEVLVTHGRVKLAASDASLEPGADAPTLDAGQRVLVPDATHFENLRQTLSISAVSPAEERAALAWQNPRLRFVNTTLGEAVQQFNQRSNTRITIADPAIATIPIGGSFRSGNVDAFLRLLASTNEITVERVEPNQVILRSQKNP
ncbi:FecR family protein [Oleiharenicola lentus]|uniref:FecR family protein n=1 Tax=Oleiharenicola lentus TaxID=2508720 RepID=UPI003F661C6C